MGTDLALTSRLGVGVIGSGCQWLDRLSQQRHAALEAEVDIFVVSDELRGARNLLGLSKTLYVQLDVFGYEAGFKGAYRHGLLHPPAARLATAMRDLVCAPALVVRPGRNFDEGASLEADSSFLGLHLVADIEQPPPALTVHHIETNGRSRRKERVDLFVHVGALLVQRSRRYEEIVTVLEDLANRVVADSKGTPVTVRTGFKGSSPVDLTEFFHINPDDLPNVYALVRAGAHYVHVTWGDFPQESSDLAPLIAPFAG